MLISVNLKQNARSNGLFTVQNIILCTHRLRRAKVYQLPLIVRQPTDKFALPLN